MYSELTKGIKASITKSVKLAFENYMRDIEWDEDAFSIEDYMAAWSEYIHEQTWYKELDEAFKTSHEFHEQLTQKLQEVLDKLLSEDPTDEQMETLKQLDKEGKLTDEIDSFCRLKAEFVIEQQTA